MKARLGHLLPAGSEADSKRVGDRHYTGYTSRALNNSRGRHSHRGLWNGTPAAVQPVTLGMRLRQETEFRRDHISPLNFPSLNLNQLSCLQAWLTSDCD